MKIRTKLLITFLSAILLPTVMTVSLFSIYFSYKTRDMEFTKTDINNAATQLSSSITSYYTTIDTIELFDEHVTNELKYYDSIIEYVEIADLNGSIVYNSRDRGRIGQKIDLYKLAAHSSSIFNYSFSQEDNDFYLKVIRPLIVDGSTKGFLLLKQNPYNLLRYAKTIAYPILWFGIASIMLVIVFFSWLISRGIIIPLKELSRATEQISSGNLDFEMQYKKGDELGTLCKAFETMRDRLKESLGKQVEYENSRKELVASISHDLRTPLTSIKGYVEGLRDGVVKDPGKFKRYLDVIYNKTNSMSKLIDDLFEFSRLDLNSLKMNKEKLESRNMLEEICWNLKYDVEKENIAFYISLNYKSFMIEADKLRIEEVISNIVFNALRYARKAIHLNADTSDNHLVISVKDDGCGINENEKNVIFNSFYRGDKSRQSSTGRAGLGLAIAKKIIEQHSGRIWVESQPGCGSTFYILIPGIDE